MTVDIAISIASMRYVRYFPHVITATIYGPLAKKLDSPSKNAVRN